MRFAGRASGRITPSPKGSAARAAGAAESEGGSEVPLSAGAPLLDVSPDFEGLGAFAELLVHVCVSPGLRGGRQQLTRPQGSGVQERGSNAAKLCESALCVVTSSLSPGALGSCQMPSKA